MLNYYNENIELQLISEYQSWMKYVFHFNLQVTNAIASSRWKD
jgi:hypothetical protein